MPLNRIVFNIDFKLIFLRWQKKSVIKQSAHLVLLHMIVQFLLILHPEHDLRFKISHLNETV